MNIDLTQEATEELDRIVKCTGLSPRMVWQKSFNLFRAYLEARSRGDNWIVLESTDIDDLPNHSRVIVPGVPNV